MRIYNASESLSCIHRGNVAQYSRCIHRSLPPAHLHWRPSGLAPPQRRERPHRCDHSSLFCGLGLAYTSLTLPYHYRPRTLHSQLSFRLSIVVIAFESLYNTPHDLCRLESYHLLLEGPVQRQGGWHKLYICITQCNIGTAHCRLRTTQASHASSVMTVTVR